MNIMLRVSLFLTAGFIASPAIAYDGYGLAKVTVVEVTYMPTRINVRLDTAIAGCPVGGWLVWLPYGSTQSEKDQNAQAALATFLTARAGGMQVQAFVKTAGCQIEFLYLS